MKSALAEARGEQAARLEAVDNLRRAEEARLRELAVELEPVFADIADGNDLFVCQVVPGEPPRLWIDVLGYVMMDPDGRSYTLVMNAREGRSILAKTAEIKEISNHVVRYIAHRTLDRERAGSPASGQFSPSMNRRYAISTVTLAWVCGFAVGGFVFLALSLVLSGG